LDETVPEEGLPDELPVDVSVGETGVAIGTDTGATVEVTTEDGPEVEVGTPPLPSPPPLPLP
jgi:hypothetical protein